MLLGKKHITLVMCMKSGECFEVGAHHSFHFPSRLPGTVAWQCGYRVRQCGSKCVQILPV